MPPDVLDIIEAYQYGPYKGHPVPFPVNDYNPLIEYRTGQIVLDRGGWWRRTALNPGLRGSQPISGNANWTLVAGEAYTVTTLNADQIAALNTVSSTQIPGPGSGNMLYITNILVLFRASTAGVFSPVGGAGNFSWFLGTTDVGILEASTSLVTSVSKFFSTGLLSVSVDGLATSGIDGSALVMKTNKAFTFTGLPATTSINAAGSGYYAGQLVLAGDLTATINTVDGTGAILTYTVTSPGTIPYAPPDTIVIQPVTTLPITGVNQGTKTFTVAGDETAKFHAGGAFTVGGSTGNDGLYTTVSATLNAGSTDIVVVEAIPDPTADGNISPGGLTGVLNVDTITNDAVLQIIAFYILRTLP